MKRIIAVLVVAVAGSVVWADTDQDYIALREQVKQLRTELARQGAYAFVTNHATTPLIAPHIHSQFWVDWLPKTNIEQVAYEQEKRDFGMDFVDELEKLALAEIPIEDADAHERRAERALAIATWLRTAEGYGNQLLTFEGNPWKRWRMVDSDDEPMVQVSDCIVSILRKYFMFLEMDGDDAIKVIEAFDEYQMANLKLLNFILGLSSTVSNRLHIQICCGSLAEKMGRIVRAYAPESDDEYADLLKCRPTE